MATRQRKMVALDVEETSGVDHPAHLHEGWVVIKSASPDDVNGIFGASVQEGNDMADQPKIEDVMKAKDDAEQRVAELEAEIELLKAAPAKEDTQEEDIMKSLPEALRKQFEDQAEELRKSQELIQKERDARLDAEAITKSKATYKAVAVDHETLAPALRRVRETSPELAEALETALLAADGQLESNGLFTELGTSQEGNQPETAEAEIEEAAKALLASGEVKTKEQGIAKAFTTNPELANRYFAEKAGK